MLTKIKIAREKSGLLQKECAKALGVTLRAWQGYEQGIREPKFELLLQIANLFNVTTDYLLGRDTGDPEPIDQLAAEFNMDLLERKILDNYLTLPDNMRGNLMDFLARTVKEVQSESNPEDIKYLYELLDDEDKAEVRGMIKQMLKDEKYSAKEKSSIG